jgi:hypothetical protein
MSEDEEEQLAIKIADPEAELTDEELICVLERILLHRGVPNGTRTEEGKPAIIMEGIGGDITVLPDPIRKEYPHLREYFAYDDKESIGAATLNVILPWIIERAIGA